MQANLELSQQRVMDKATKAWRPTHRVTELRPAFLGEVAEYVYKRPAAQQAGFLAELGWELVLHDGPTYQPVLKGTAKDVTPNVPTPMPPDGRRQRGH